MRLDGYAGVVELIPYRAQHASGYLPVSSSWYLYLYLYLLPTTYYLLPNTYYLNHVHPLSTTKVCRWTRRASLTLSHQLKTLQISIMKQSLILAFTLGLALPGCVVDSSDPKPDSTHVLIVTVEKITANGACEQGGAEISTEIELYISTREEGTPSRADEKEEFESLLFTAFETKAPRFTLETDFALEDQVLVEARIKTSDENHSFSPKEEFWHGSYYDAGTECWVDDRWLNVFVDPGCRDGGVEFVHHHETSMAYGLGCQVWYEWTVRVERI